MRRTEHGGQCCGINHISDFGQIKSSRLLYYLDNNIAERKQQRRSGLIEVVLTDKQAVNWDETLIRRGFIRVNRFLNSNSGNYCNVYHLKTGQNFFKDLSEDGFLNAFGFYMWREMKSLFYTGMSFISILLIYLAVGLIEKAM